MTAFIPDPLHGQLSPAIPARQMRRPWGASGLGIFQVLAILGLTSLRHQDLTVQRVNRKENMLSMEKQGNEVMG